MYYLIDLCASFLYGDDVRIGIVYLVNYFAHQDQIDKEQSIFFVSDGNAVGERRSLWL